MGCGGAWIGRGGAPGLALLADQPGLVRIVRLLREAQPARRNQTTLWGKQAPVGSMSRRGGGTDLAHAVDLDVHRREALLDGLQARAVSVRPPRLAGVQAQIPGERGRGCRTL